jgi:hypothetical protein
VSKPLVAGIALTVFLSAASDANKSLRDSAEERRVFANAHSNEAVRLSTAGLADKTLVIETSPPDSNQCPLPWVLSQRICRLYRMRQAAELALLASKLATLEMVGTFQPTPST